MNVVVTDSAGSIESQGVKRLVDQGESVRVLDSRYFGRERAA